MVNMKKYARYLAFALILVLTGVIAQTVPPAGGGRTFTQQELDQMLAPIALYPDPLLSQILMAATYPLEVVQAARWSSANPALTGDAAVQAVDSQDWDPSVKSLVAFPQVLQTLDQNLDWTERLGDAFLAQQPQVMDTIQNLRQKAQAAGNLNSNPQFAVTQAVDNIEILPANPDVIYVPYYDPAVIYGSWWWPDYPPVFWAPWVGYGWNGEFAWGIGIGIGVDFFFGSWDWHNHRVFSLDRGGSGNSHLWQHDPGHRHAVPYRNAVLNQQFGRTTATSASRVEFRGYLPSASAVPKGAPLPEMREGVAPRNMSQPTVGPRAHAFENVERGADVRSFSARGQASLSGRSSAPVSSGGSSRSGRR